jgi:hypothetical protein
VKPAHIRILSQNRRVATLLCDVAVSRMHQNCNAHQHRANHRCIGPVVRSAEEKSLMHCGKVKLSGVTSRCCLTVKRLVRGLARQRVQCLFLLGMLMLSASATDAHEFITTKITWAREISRVLNRRCISCHHSGGPAFDLGAYEQARPWAEAIKQEVLERRMPPWGAIKGFGDFRDEEGLTEMEIAVISSWVEGGAPRGDLTLLPKQTKINALRSRAPKTGEILVASGSLTLERRIKVAAVRPEAVPEGASLRLIAERPNGAVEPLIWLYGYASRFKRTYYFKTPMSFGFGTRIRIEPAVGSVSLLLVGG